MKFKNMMLVSMAALMLVGYNEGQNMKVTAEEGSMPVIEEVVTTEEVTPKETEIIEETAAKEVVVKAVEQVETVVEATIEQAEQVYEETQVVEETKAIEEAVQQSGYQLTVEASAYSYQEAGLSPYAADGTNLINSPQVIAVDPSVIPLGSLVEIPGYGVYRAADTGGAIKGNKIDIHMTSVAAMNQFGRRTITIKVLN